jgi:uncharacterized membrane protein
MGLLAGTVLYPSISETKTKKFTLWGIRIVALVLAVVAFALTTKNFCKCLLRSPRKGTNS